MRKRVEERGAEGARKRVEERGAEGTIELRGVEDEGIVCEDNIGSHHGRTS